MDTTIINDTQNRDTHMLAGLITLIKCMGAKHASTAAQDLIEWVYQQDNENSLAPCPQGYHRDANGVCVPDVG